MRSPLKVLLVTGSLLAASLGAFASAATAATAPPVMDTSAFACSNGVCEVGPGNVGMPFAAGLNVKLGDPLAGEAEFGYEYTMKIISGSLPPGLQLSLPSTEWTVTGTPTKAGTYPFTVQITPGPDIGGPAGTQQLTITIGTGSSDRLVVTGAGFTGTCSG
jgi:Putative Ig domain